MRPAVDISESYQNFIKFKYLKLELFVLFENIKVFMKNLKASSVFQVIQTQ